MKPIKLLFVLSLLAIMTVADGCKKGPSKTKYNTTKVKKGKPLPCPLKDC
jgi:hypothetical protein